MQNDQKPIVAAILLAGAMIAGAIMLRGTSAPAGPTPIAKQIGLNVKKFNSCVESGKFKAKVDADIADGLKAGLDQPERGTPFSVIFKNGEPVDIINGARPLEAVLEQLTEIRGSEKTPMATEMRPVSPDDHIVGDINSEIIIVEYSDLDCPYCKVFHNTMHQVIEQSEGKVAWVYRHYPIPQLHPNAPKKAEETECAWELGGNEAFWKYADKVFSTPQQ
ncbi:MAG: thioredoxin domain-containing protein [bacterium]|nr:thioredoxin domain-containing protein [bacterium]